MPTTLPETLGPVKIGNAAAERAKVATDWEVLPPPPQLTRWAPVAAIEVVAIEIRIGDQTDNQPTSGYSGQLFRPPGVETFRKLE